MGGIYHHPNHSRKRLIGSRAPSAPAHARPETQIRSKKGLPVLLKPSRESPEARHRGGEQHHQPENGRRSLGSSYIAVGNRDVTEQGNDGKHKEKHSDGKLITEVHIPPPDFVGLIPNSLLLYHILINMSKKQKVWKV